MGDYHESYDALDEQTRNFTRALNSLKEEIEAVDWYNQRVALATDPELKEIMAHNRDEEMEHAIMTLEWLRRNMPGWDDEMRTYLFKQGNIAHMEDGEEGEEESGESNSGSNDGSLGLGKMNK
jgi:ferritin-like protein